MSNDPSSPARIQDVAQRAGVSSATVSRVLAGKPYVSAAVRERVLVTIQELKYQPSRVARSLRVQTSKILGLIISDIENPFFTSLVRAVEDVANVSKLIAAFIQRMKPDTDFTP